MNEEIILNLMHDVRHLDTGFGEETKLSTPSDSAITCRFAAIKEHLYSDLNGEAVILSMKNGKYYGLNGVGRTIWTALKEPTSLEAIRARVMSEYEVDEDICRREVLSFLQKMLGEGLIEVLDGKAA